MKPAIVSISIDRYIDHGAIWVYRGEFGVRGGLSTKMYPILTLTQYQRAVRLLNAFVERNMK